MCSRRGRYILLSDDSVCRINDKLTVFPRCLLCLSSDIARWKKALKYMKMLQKHFLDYYHYCL